MGHLFRNYYLLLRFETLHNNNSHRVKDDKETINQRKFEVLDWLYNKLTKNNTIKQQKKGNLHRCLLVKQRKTST